jgi:peptidoglycan/LPS O-acetylase OafA/YrhL
MHFKQIDSVRFFSVLFVMISHWLANIPFIENLKLGTIGVEMFFTISGFLISLQLLNYKTEVDKKTYTLKKTLFIFYIRRILRIFPLYYFILLVATLINKGEILAALPWNITYTTNFYFIKTQHWPSTFSQFWSLSVEEHFYIFWPFLVLLTPAKHLFKCIILVAICSLAFRFWQFHSSYDFILLNIHTLSCLDLFMMGALLAFLVHRGIFFQLFTHQYLKTIAFVLFTLLLLINISKPQWELFNWVFQRFFFGFFYFILLGFLVKGFTGKIVSLLENKYFIRLGKLSYCMYLIHNFVPGILLPIKEYQLPSGFEFFIYLMVTILLSEVLYRLIEQPMRNLNTYFTLNTDSENAAK